MLRHDSQLEDNLSNVQTYAAGQVVNFKVTIVAHHTGWAATSGLRCHVSSCVPHILTTSTANFNVTIPELDGKCSEMGACAIE
ncbi:hypothetical protein BKA62DRAFT_620080 [Auriculariales sp. MPI-PUGE-AT-0066]|nr:hypothetical protein BKA62DRAFT_620080 [Auriculariales sp. MPI-PUGE-AT-0066]